MSTDRLLFELKDGNRPLPETIFGLSAGALPSPASTGLSSERWMWLADLLTHPQWGMTAVVDGLHHVCAPVARLCRLTANAIHPLNLRELWAAEQQPTIDLLAMHSPHDSGHWEALTAVRELISDGLDHCHGLDISGVEAVTAAFTAIITAQVADTARATITAATSHAPHPTPVEAPKLPARLGVAS
ncbi:hypothetical protein [Rhodococcus sp. IEGM 1379]|uniref:hypothetical protein n=1 Tax=Rhodococcus sp. IEGM 1379 TaxID=3047086 RepID=UPI0024B686B0|nr:hypothetical protein [Rhodococcus sp. IEGM 1379]MDI9915386.1 hypothetical protein [Rhodococcus sp. IEGM 1379]